MALMSSGRLHGGVVTVRPWSRCLRRGSGCSRTCRGPASGSPYSGYVLELLEKLGPVPPHDRPSLLLYSERDIQALLDGSAGLMAQLPGSEKRLVTRDIRPDVQHESGLVRYLPRWFNHSELRFNSSACEASGHWLAEHLATA